MILKSNKGGNHPNYDKAAKLIESAGFNVLRHNWSRTDRELEIMSEDDILTNEKIEVLLENNKIEIVAQRHDRTSWGARVLPDGVKLF